MHISQNMFFSLWGRAGLTIQTHQRELEINDLNTGTEHETEEVNVIYVNKFTEQDCAV